MAWVWAETPRKDEFVHAKNKSEATELDYQASQAMLTRDAPFGTEDTPSMKERIIGGRYVSVLERPYGQNAPRYEKLSLVSDKPNHVDPRALNDFSRRYNKPYQDPFTKNSSLSQPANVLKRPDSKDIRSRYPRLPPIEENRLKNNQISTVFEPEAWTRQHRVDDKENHQFPRRVFDPVEPDRTNGIKPLYDPRGSGVQGSRHSDPGANNLRQSYDAAVTRRGQQDTPSSKEQFVKKLTAMLPNNVFLPERPLILSEDDEVRLLEVIAEELNNYSPLKLRDIYLDIANTSDKNLSGYCQYQDLYYSMNRQMLSMPGDLLQLAAAMFVSPDRPNRDVNYEKFLSFIGLALKQGGVEQQLDNYFADSEHAKLISMVEQQLRENDFVIDFSKLENELKLADRLSKGFLELRTVMDVCYQLNIPLQSSVLNRVLAKCRFNNYDDKYSWRTFLEILTKAQPTRIRNEPVRLGTNPYSPPSPPPQPQRFSPQPHKPVTPLYRREPVQPSHDPRTSMNYGNGYNDDGSREEVISRMDQDIRQLERNYEEIKDKMRPRDDTPWFKNFIQFADALYKQDQSYDGDLPAEDVYRWTKMYNEASNLGLPDHLISKALSDSTKAGKVHIHSYLAKLGNVADHEKIV
ncbi:uncharacterized protein [Littorina saxatilis]|uniref:DUF5580 domain-containing protein n=1 Tax=Littorina saxatilis TaxID=31220 RepID=A0AAN9GAJ6_9CAEN